MKIYLICILLITLFDCSVETKKKSDVAYSEIKTPITPEDTSDCLHAIAHIVWKQSNYWKEFKKNVKNELYGDINTEETSTYINDVQGDIITIQIDANDDYVKKHKLNHGFFIVSWLSLNTTKNQLWLYNELRGDSIELKFDTLLMPLIRGRCTQHYSSF